MNRNKIFKTMAFSIALAWPQVFAGTVEGEVKFDGAAPKLKALEMNADPICKGKHDSPVKSDVLVLGEGNVMANVFVKVSKGLTKKDYPAPKDPLVLDQKGCVYSPHVSAVQVNQSIKILNPDGTMHNVHALPKVNKEFNMAMPKFRKEALKSFKKPEGMFPIKCDVHPWMSAWIAVVDHPFFAVTGKDGKFKLENLPAGTYEIEAWHEKLGTKTASVTVKGDEAQTLAFTFSK